MTKKEIYEDIKDGIKKWERVGNIYVPVFYLYYYYPTSYEEIKDHQDWAREFIWDFKNGGNTEDAVEQVTTVLQHFFLSETLSELTFLCIPASTQKKNKIRYEDFSKEVSMECGMCNGYDHIGLKYDKDKAKHLGGEKDYNNLKFDEEWFKDKRIILFDDVVTSGSSIGNIKKELKNFGAKVIGAITLGRTVHHDCGEDPYDAMDHSVKQKKPSIDASHPQTSYEITYSAQESARLFRLYESAERVASERRLALSTIYLHLFITGALDPLSSITQEEYEKACKFYKGGFKQPSLELDKFLSVKSKTAYYLIQNEGLEAKFFQKAAMNNARTLFTTTSTDPIKESKLEDSKDVTKTRVETSVEASVRLFNLYSDVKIVALHRGFKETTIYEHLFKAGVLNPHDYITESEFIKASQICKEEGDAEIRYVELDKILDLGARAAFYYIKRTKYSQQRNSTE